MSIWSDLQDRSSGRVTRKEDEERDFVVNMDYVVVPLLKNWQKLNLE